jgi:hypothetical protein
VDRKPKKLTEPARQAIPPLTDPAETEEGVLRRRTPTIESGDVVIRRAHGGLISSKRPLFELRIEGSVVRQPERFATFEHAAARGDDLASARLSRLFYLETEAEPPCLLKDARRR